MRCLIRKIVGFVGIVTTSAFVIGAAPAKAVTFDIFKAGTAQFLGTFDAPAAGGLVTAISLTVSGHTFDVLGSGILAPSYNAVNNDLGGTGSGVGGVFNSVASGICGVGQCTFSLFRIIALPVPGEWSVDQFSGPGSPQHITGGFYDIKVAAIPLPAGAVLFTTALAGLGLMRRRRRS